MQKDAISEDPARRDQRGAPSCDTECRFLSTRVEVVDGFLLEPSTPPRHALSNAQAAVTPTPEQLIETLRARPFRAYPVVTDDREFLGCVKRRTLLRHLGRVFRSKGLMVELEQLMPMDIALVRKPKSGKSSRHAFKDHHPPHNGHHGSSSTAPLGVVLRSPAESARQHRKLLDSEMDIRIAQDVSVDPSAFRVSELCPLNDVYALFDLTRCNRVFVVSYGVLVGVISRRILIQNIKTLQETWRRTPSLLLKTSSDGAINGPAPDACKESKRG